MDETSGPTMVDSVDGANSRLRNVDIGVAAHYGRGYRFNGSSSVVTVPHTRAHNVSSPTFTVDASCALPRTIGDFDLVRKGLSGTDGGHWKMEIFSNGKGYCQFRESSGTVTVNAGPRLDDNRWHRISCVKRTGSVTLVVDGRSYKRRKRTGRSATASLAIGAKASGGDEYRGDGRGQHQARVSAQHPDRLRAAREQLAGRAGQPQLRERRGRPLEGQAANQRAAARS